VIETQNIPEIMNRSFRERILISVFNVAFIPIIKPIVETLVECETFGLVEVAGLELKKFGAKSFEAVAEYREYSL